MSLCKNTAWSAVPMVGLFRLFFSKQLIKVGSQNSRSFENSGVKLRKSQKLRAQLCGEIATMMLMTITGTMTSGTWTLTQSTIGWCTHRIILVCPRQYLYPIPALQTATRSLLKIYGIPRTTATMVSLIMGLWPAVNATVVIYLHHGTVDPMFPPDRISSNHIFHLRFPTNLHTIPNYLN